MDLFFSKLLSSTRFTTNGIAKDFLPRRVGLGYRAVHVRLSREVIRPCVRMRNRRRSGETSVDVQDECDEDCGKSAMVKRRRDTGHLSLHNTGSS